MTLNLIKFSPYSAKKSENYLFLYHCTLVFSVLNVSTDIQEQNFYNWRTLICHHGMDYGKLLSAWNLSSLQFNLFMHIMLLYVQLKNE